MKPGLHSKPGGGESSDPWTVDSNRAREAHECLAMSPEIAGPTDSHSQERIRPMIRTMKIFGLSLALLAVAAFATVNPSAAQTTNRPLSDFLSTQGTTTQYFPPVPDFIGWTNNNPPTLFAAVDYAGLVAKYLAAHGGPSLGTTISGGITETRLADGTYEVVVTTSTKNALAWACDVSNIFTNPTLFGSRGSELAANPN